MRSNKMVNEKMIIIWMFWLFYVEIINVRCINYDDIAKKKMRPMHIAINKEMGNISHATGSLKTINKFLGKNIYLISNIVGNIFLIANKFMI